MPRILWPLFSRTRHDSTYICVLKKDTLQEHLIGNLAAAATTYVYLTNHSGEITLLPERHTREKLPE